MNHHTQPLQHMPRHFIKCCCNGFLLCTALMLYMAMAQASLEPVNNHLAVPAAGNTAPQQNFSIANPKLNLSTHMSSIALHEAPAASPQEERDELLVAARAQPSQNRSDLGAAGAQDSKAAPVAENEIAVSKVEKTYKEENNYLLALALILLTGGVIAYVLFSKRQ